MFNKFFLCLFLLPISIINTMERGLNNPMQTALDDLIVYNITTRLDRIDRNDFKRTSKKYSLLILSQAQLNENYTQACKDKNGPAKIEWRKKGALEPYEEIHNLVIDKRPGRNILAQALWRCYPQPMMTRDSLSYGIEHNKLPFISWILKMSKPQYDSGEIHLSLVLSKRLKRRTIIICLENYIEQAKSKLNQTSVFDRFLAWFAYDPSSGERELELSRAHL